MNRPRPVFYLQGKPFRATLGDKADNDKSPLGISLRVATRHRAAVAP